MADHLQRIDLAGLDLLEKVFPVPAMARLVNLARPRP